jgi:hypothetical protein
LNNQGKVADGATLVATLNKEEKIEVKVKKKRKKKSSEE